MGRQAQYSILSEKRLAERARQAHYGDSPQ